MDFANSILVLKIPTLLMIITPHEICTNTSRRTALVDWPESRGDAQRGLYYMAHPAYKVVF